METTHLTPAPHCSAGLQPLRRLAFFLGLAAVLLLAGAALVVPGVRSAHPGTTRQATCHATQVTLRGDAAPTVTCLDGKPLVERVRKAGGAGPLASYGVTAYPCYADSLAIYQGWYQSGPTLCLNGAGEINLTRNFGGYWWNDDVKSFWIGCSAAFFYVDINQGGGTAFAPGSPYGQNALYGTFPYQNVGVNQLSSVYVIPGGTC